MRRLAADHLGLHRWAVWVVTLICLLPSAQAQSPCFGVGDRYHWHLDNTHYKTTPQLLSWLDFPGDNRLLGIWLPAGWKPTWLKGLQSAMDSGYVPVLLDYPLGDIYQHGRQAWRYVESHRNRFLSSVSRLAQTLHPLHGTVLVVLQPEFNIPGVQDRPAFGYLLARAAGLLHRAAHPGLRILVGTCVGDFGHYGQKVEDRGEWARFSPALTPAIPQLDFLAFQEMRGGTHRDVEGHMRSYTPEQEGIEVLGRRTAAFSAFLQKKYRKPLLLAYFVVATMTPPGQPAGTWEKAAKEGYSQLFDAVPSMAHNGVFGVMAMSLFDDPAHNNNGLDFWGNASDSFGLVTANARLGQDRIGYPPYVLKPAGRVWLSRTRAVAGAVCSPASW